MILLLQGFIGMLVFRVVILVLLMFGLAPRVLDNACVVCLLLLSLLNFYNSPRRADGLVGFSASSAIADT